MRANAVIGRSAADWRWRRDPVGLSDDTERKRRPATPLRNMPGSDRVIEEDDFDVGGSQPRGAAFGASTLMIGAADPGVLAVEVDNTVVVLARAGLRRLVDILLALLGIAASLPLLLMVPIAIKAVDRRCPILVSLPLVGRRGKLFRMYKFSTMVVDADRALADLLARDPILRVEWDARQKLAEDPRVLPVIGKFLRKYSINELPQLFNVLRGDMAIVGPRPISRSEEAKYIEYGGADLLRRRQAVRPGITGLWQVSGRNDISYRQRVLLDDHYLRNRSLLLDLRILMTTVLVVARGNGAY